MDLKRGCRGDQGRLFIAMFGVQVRIQSAVMARRVRGTAEEHKNGEGMACNLLGRAQIPELGLWFKECASAWSTVRRASAHVAPLAIDCGFRSARVGEGRFNLSNSSYPALFRSSAISGNMVRPRQCLLSRRGSSRGGPSRPSVATPPSRCCRCLCHQVAEAHPIQLSHFLDSSNPDSDSAPLPVFGTVVFSFNSAQGNSRINAHVSVLFLEEPKEEGEEQPSTKVHQAGSSRGAEGSPEAGPEHAVIPPSAQAAPSPEKDKTAWDSLPEGCGWCGIIEEEPDE